MAELSSLYKEMLRSRLFERAVAQLWQEGFISGEMHLGLGEEAIAAGIVCQLQDGDALALDYRGTPELLMRGVDPAALLDEFLGREDGLCRGMGGHMHLFSRAHLAASSGIVGASGPAAVGFALSGRRLRPRSVAVAFFGDGAMNQGMLMESMNLAAAWRLPVLFVCKDNQWAVTTRSEAVTGGSLVDRARAFGLTTFDVDGRDVEQVQETACPALEQARNGGGPAFLRARCVRLEGHFLGDALMRSIRRPLQEMPATLGPMLRSAIRVEGVGLRARISAMMHVTSTLSRARQLSATDDPLQLAKQKLVRAGMAPDELEGLVRAEIQQIVERATQREPTSEMQP